MNLDAQTRRENEVRVGACRNEHGILAEVAVGLKVAVDTLFHSRLGDTWLELTGHRNLDCRKANERATGSRHWLELDSKAILTLIPKS